MVRVDEGIGEIHMVALDFTVLIDATMTAVSDVLTSLITAVSTYADEIAVLAVGGLVMYGAIKISKKLFKGIGGLIRGLSL
jgi:PHP family Zn ribbon phosphoesterase